MKTIKLENCIITGNDANEGGGLSLDLYLEAQINNCTFSENTAHNVGGAIHIEDTTPMIVNSILWGNSPDEIFGTPLVTYSDVQGGWAGTGNINVDPLFRDPEFDDYYLMWTECADPTDSPCIDAGHPDSSDVLLDCFHGLGTAYCDMGAYGGRNGEPPTVIEKGKIKKSVFIPRTFNLYQNYPNPFNPSTTIKIDIPGVSGEEQHVEVTVYDLRGRRVKTLISSALESGSHKLHWDGRNDKGESVSSGIYLYSLRSSSQSITRRMTLLK